MSGTLVIRDAPAATWTPSSWIYDSVSRRLAADLRTTDAELASVFTGGLVEGGQGCSDLRHLNEQQCRRVHDAARRVYDGIFAEGPTALVSPDAFAGYLFLFSEFKALLRIDPRMSEGEIPTAGVRLNGTTTWTAPSWVHDLVLEHLAADVRTQDPALAKDLMAARALEGGTALDLTGLSPSSFRLLLPGADVLSARYGDGRGRSAVAPDFFAALAPHVRKFKDAVLADPRSAEGDRIARS